MLQSKLIFGTFKLTSISISAALKNNLTILDTATGYNNAKEINHAMKLTNIKPTILTKFNPTDFETGIESVAHQHNEDLGIEPEMVLLHSPMISNEENIVAFKKLRELYPTKIVGISNFGIQQIQYLIENNCKPQIISLEFSPFFQPNELVEYCKNNDIVITGYRPTCKGEIFNSDVIKHIAYKHKTSIANIVLKWIYMKGIIPIISSTKEEHIRDNIQFDQIELSESDIDMLDRLNKGPSGATCMLRYCKL